MALFRWRHPRRAGIRFATQEASARFQAPVGLGDERLVSLESFLSDVESHADSFFAEMKEIYDKHIGAIKSAAQELVTVQDSPLAQTAESLLPPPVREIFDEFAAKLAAVTSELPGASTAPASAAPAAPAVPVNPPAAVPQANASANPGAPGAPA